MKTYFDMKTALFTMDDALLKNDGIMEEGIVEPNSDHLVTLVLHNDYPVFLSIAGVVQEMSKVVADVAIEYSR